MHSFLLDLRRLFSRRMSLNLRNLFLENFLQPMAVAVFVLFAFVNRSGFVDHRETLVYFSTLYAFWIGIFGSCQALNMELRNGEWSYWVLGMGRSKWVHLAAVVTSNLFFATTQLLVFLATIFAFRFLQGVPLLNIGNVYANFIRDFCSVATPGAALFQMQGMLRIFLNAILPNGGVDLFVFSVFGFSLFIAALSGIGFGIMFSTIFKDPLVSLNISVGFVVIIGIISFKGLDSGNDNEETELINSSFGITAMELTRPASANYNRSAPSAGLKSLVAASRFLPQRYFYNIGTITFKRSIAKWNNDDGTKGNECETFVSEFWGDEKKPEWLEYASQGQKVSVLADLEDNRMLYGLTNAVLFSKLMDIPAELCIKDESQFVSSVSGLIQTAARDEIGYYSAAGFFRTLRLILITIFIECLYILSIFFACICVTVFVLNKKDVFHALR